MMKSNLSFQEFKMLALNNYSHLLEYNESLTKDEYQQRLKQMYSLDGDPRNRVFFNMAESISFEKISRSHKGVSIQ